MALLVGAIVGIARTREVFGVVVLLGIYSFLVAGLMLALDAVDVAMTEAAVGAGISTVLFLGAMFLTKAPDESAPRSRAAPIAAVALTGAMLLYGISDLPPFGVAGNPVHVAGPDYMARTIEETGIPNAVTSVLASYRGFDTLGETTVILTAGIGVLALLRRKRRPARKEG